MKNYNLIKKILQFFNLDTELENPEKIYDEIKKGIIFKGTNLWILIFAIVIASVGLNMNSTAVIIGAMLISPLMGPINGMGYGIATYDFELLRKSIKNFTFAIFASLIASTVYFALSPVSTAHSELLARTSPTIYDVLIALFGGLAGIVAISSRFKGNVIPGVAIATALMPPLCTSGYGIATGQFEIFFGAIYLFTINTVFIAIASVLISRILKFPLKSNIEENRIKRLRRIITAIIIIVLLPSIFFGYKLVKQEELLQNAKKYVASVSNYEGNYLLKFDIDEKSGKIVLVYGGKSLTDSQKNLIISKAEEFNIKNADIKIVQGLNLGIIDDKNLEMNKLKEQVVALNYTLTEKDKELDSLKNRQKLGETLLNEIKTIYPQLSAGSYSETFSYNDSLSSPVKLSVIVLSSKKNIQASDKIKIKNWFRQRLNTENLKIFYE